MAFPNFTWNWMEMCGPGGMVPWYPTSHDIGACFQQLFLQVPVLTLFALASAYYYGFRQRRCHNRPSRLWIVRTRLFCSATNALLPIIRAIIGVTYLQGMFRPVDYLTAGAEMLAWSVHSGYVLSLRYRQKVHGPIIVRVLWTLIAVLSIINLRTLVLGLDQAGPTIFGFLLATLICQGIYGLTFFSFCCTNSAEEEIAVFNERSSLLSSHYSSFREEVDPCYLGVAMENESTSSKLIFNWVNPLLKKGRYLGKQFYVTTVHSFQSKKSAFCKCPLVTAVCSDSDPPWAASIEPEPHPGQTTILIFYRRSG